MKKSILALLLIFSLIFILVACGDPENDDPSDGTPPVSGGNTEQTGTSGSGEVDWDAVDDKFEEAGDPEDPADVGGQGW